MACLALRDHVLGSRGSGTGFWRKEPVEVLRKTSNRGPAEGWIEFEVACLWSCTLHVLLSFVAVFVFFGFYSSYRSL